jgi:hypothetical protein
MEESGVGKRYKTFNYIRDRRNKWRKIRGYTKDDRTFGERKIRDAGNQRHVDYVKRLGRVRESRGMLEKLTTFSKELEVLRNTRKLAGTKIKVEQDYSREVRQIRRNTGPVPKRC